MYNVMWYSLAQNTSVHDRTVATLLHVTLLCPLNSHAVVARVRLRLQRNATHITEHNTWFGKTVRNIIATIFIDNFVSVFVRVTISNQASSQYNAIVRKRTTKTSISKF